MPARDLFKLIYRTLTAFITVVLAGGAVLAWWYSTPGNGLLLIAGILGILALIVGLSISRLDDQDRAAETYKGIIDEARSRFGISRNMSAGGTTSLSFGRGGAAVTVKYDEPEVHRVDNAMLDEAKRMAAEGTPIDDICRMIDPEHDAHDEFHQEAFRRMVRAMVDEG